MTYNAVVGEDFLTINDALNNFRGSKEPLFLFIKGGIYKERLNISRDNVTLIGDKDSRVTITFNTTAESSEGRSNVSGTWSCSTVNVSANNFYAENITFENSFNYPENEKKADDDPTKVQHAQAVAFMSNGNSDNIKCKNCSFISYQDTLFIDRGNHHFDNCTISGHVDFIFGAGQALFTDCTIISRNRLNKFPTGYIIAPSTLPSFPFGFIFKSCNFIKESDVPVGSVCLGRPWHPNADLRCSGAALFYNCFMDDHIGKLGYDKISAVNNSGQRVWFDITPDSRLFEFKSYGPGAMINETRPQLDEDALPLYINHIKSIEE